MGKAELEEAGEQESRGSDNEEPQGRGRSGDEAGETGESGGGEDAEELPNMGRLEMLHLVDGGGSAV